MYYVYCLVTETGAHRYAGFTEDVRQRVDDHNRGSNRKRLAGVLRLRY